MRQPDATFTPFDVPNSNVTCAVAINDAGQIIGFYGGTTCCAHGYLRQPDGTSATFDTFDVAGSFGTFPEAINDTREITGEYQNASADNQGFLRQPDGTIVKFDPVGSIDTFAPAINAGGQITGSYDDANFVLHGYLRQPDGTIITLDAPGSISTQATAINDAGQIAGTYVDTAHNQHGFLRQANGHFDTFDVPNSIGINVTGINSTAQIAGWFSDTSFVYHGFLRQADRSFVTFEATGPVYLFTSAINSAGEITGTIFDQNLAFSHGFLFTSATLAEQAAALARTLLTAPYGYGGKGYDLKLDNYVDVAAIFGNYNHNVFDCSTGNVGLLPAPGVDCSGLVMWSYNTAFGATKDFDDNDNPIQYQTANGQYLENTGDVSKAALKPGDLLFFNYEHGTDPKTGLPKAADHVAMYVGGDDVIEAYTCNPKYPTGNFVIRSSASNRYKSDPITGQNLPSCTPGLLLPCFVGFRTVTAPKVKLGIYPASPITLAVTDPDGFTISADTLSFTDREVLREVGDVLYYGDSDAVISPVLKPGAYLIEVFPKSGTVPTETYSLVVKAAGTTLTLADKVPISDIPSLGYGIESTGTTINAFIPVAIDIKPGDTLNSINRRGAGNIPVGVLSTPTFNAPSSVNETSLTFGRTGNEHSLAFCNSGGQDVNGDGLLDLVCHFTTSKTDFTLGDTQGVLKGTTVDGVPFVGTDSVRIIK